MEKREAELTAQNASNSLDTQSSVTSSEQVSLIEGGMTVPHRILENARLTPNKTAIIFDGQEHTYRDLILSAARIGEALKARDVTPGDRIAVLMQPGYTLVCSLLAIHFTGCTYIPIDPMFPKSRIEMIFEDVDPSVIVFDPDDYSEPGSTFGAIFSNRLLDITQLEASDGLGPEVFEPAEISLNNESHIFFTSGTTGRPKGAVSTHQNLAHGMFSSIRCFKLKPEMSILSVAGASFSISTFELLAMLACGGHTVIARRHDILDISRLFQLASTVAVWHFVPTLLARVIDHVERAPDRVGQLSNLQCILTGGDNVPSDLLARIRNLLPDVNLYVNYGASETNCMVTYWPVELPKPLKTKIGFPQKNVQLQVLDSNRRPVPIGGAGELFVASPGVIKGYLHREDLNFEKFYRHQGIRYFASGDIVRAHEDGTFEMLGREDFQIQFNGNRIELLEVEAAVKRVKGIKNCVVAAKQLQSEGNTKTLVAYVVMEQGQSPGVNEIKSFLSAQLPAYMVPSMYLAIEQIPTNHNGKIDRINLPDPAGCAILQSRQREPLVGEVEHQIAKFWRDLLKVDNIHAHTDFFETGGDSIAAVRAVARLSDAYSCQLTISDIVENATVRTLGNRISQQQSNTDRKESTTGLIAEGCIPLRQGDPSLSPLLLINGVVEYLHLAKSIDSNRPIYALFLPEEVDLILKGSTSDAVESTNSIEGVSRLYLSLVKKVQPNGPYLLVGKSFGGIIAIEVSRALIKSGETVDLIGLLDTIVPDTFTAHKKLSFRLGEHLRRTAAEGPAYLLGKIRQRLLTRKNTSGDDGVSNTDSETDNIRIRHKTRKTAILSTRLDSIEMPLTLIKASDRKFLYGERPQNDLGWGKYAKKLVIHEVPGEHHSMLNEANAPNVARIIEKII
ncbi:AMP-binding protein [Microbulbifer agarilyticus]|uniref:AMP-binding protein n=1 Tax=Microbulbifer agarilyticus TaxID=260552 RepID=UPI001CD36579|nr:AMP-binding protein [Microbulbifer agarilyticus]MCA0894916.1 AMP-binding protein [Microbulbifer agarilyticus]